MPQKPKVVWYNPDETYRIKYYDLIWIKYKVVGYQETITGAALALRSWNKDKNYYTPFINSPYITYLGFAICPPGTKDGDMYVE